MRPPYPDNRAPKERPIILLVDDDPCILRYNECILEKCGYEVLSASSGREAMEIFNKCRQQNKHIHKLLTDIVMPEMDGIELSRHLTKAQPDLQVIFITGYSNCILGLDAKIIYKPYKPEDLLKAIE